jgi:hypothetical protein
VSYGPKFVVTGFRPYPGGTQQGTLTFAYADFVCGPPTLVLAEEPRGSNATLVPDPVIPNVWLLQNVDQGSVHSVQVVPVAGCACRVPCAPMLKIPVPVVPCTQYDLNLEVVGTGPTCVRLQWDLYPSFGLFTYSVVVVSTGNQVVQSTTASTTLVIGDLQPSTTYAVTVTTQCGVSATVQFQTTPAPFLGPTMDITWTLDEGGETWSFAFEYVDYSADSVTIQSIQYCELLSPNLWRCIVNLPSQTFFNMVVTYEVQATVCSPAYTANSVLSLQAPNPPADICPAVLGLDVEVLGPSCARLVWSSDITFAGGYSYQLTGAGTTISGSVRYGATEVLLTGLAVDTEYGFAIAGVCIGSTLGPPATIGFTTPPLTVISFPNNPIFVVIIQDAVDSAFSGTITYGNDVSGLVSPALTLDTTSAPEVIATQFDAFGWTVRNMTAATTYTFDIFGFFSTDACDPAVPIVRQAITTTFTTPEANEPSCTTVPLTLQLTSITPTCVTATANTTDASAFPGGFQFTLHQGDTQVQQVDTTDTEVVFSGLTPAVGYQVSLQGFCDPDTSSALVSEPFTTLTAPSPPSLAPFTTPACTVTFSEDGTQVTLGYPKSFASCVVLPPILSFSTDHIVSGAVITYVSTAADLTWHITGLVPEDVTYLTLTTSALGTSVNCTGCSGTTGTTISTSFTIGPATPPTPPPLVTYNFTVVIPNYGGPPGRILAMCSLNGTQEVCQGAGTTYGSAANITQNMKDYGELVVYSFLDYQITGKYSLPVSWVYFGSVIDPFVQGMAAVTQIADGSYVSKKPYNFADTAYYVNPPVLQPYLALMNLNWKYQNLPGTPYRPVAMGMTVYGSKGADRWFFNCTFGGEGGGAIVPLPVNNPTTNDPCMVPSVVTGENYDGNSAPPGPGNTPNAGWNCLERWFMHVGYLNQQLRAMIASGDVTCTIGEETRTMTLSDLSTDNVKFYQVSAITLDSEGNAFENFHPTAPDNNAVMKALWDKWINQRTGRDTPAGLPNVPTPTSFVTASNAYAPSTQILPGTGGSGQPYIPCAMSMTTPGLLPGMAMQDVGTPDFDAIQFVFNEVYDTSDAQPYPYLGAGISSVSMAPPALGSVAFTPALYSDVDSAKGDAEVYVLDKGHGTWDNLGTTATNDTKSTVPLTYIDQDGNLSVLPTSSQGGPTVLTDGSSFGSPLMSSSQYPPWSNAAGHPWNLVNRGGVTSGNTSPDITVDSVSYGYALESCRYDLAVGYWGLASQPQQKPVDYTQVKQGVAGADGAALWRDLTTGLKYRVSTAIPTSMQPNQLSNMVWMLSCEAGPWINSRSLKASLNTGDHPNPDAADTLTFTCPDSALPNTTWGGFTNWPGWTGMKSQNWGASSCSVKTEGVLQRWSLDQCYLPNSVDPDVVVNTIATEDNFGVFADLGIIVAVWTAIGQDLVTGICPSRNKPKATSAQTLVMGCYELAFLPLAWLGKTGGHAPQ